MPNPLRSTGPLILSTIVMLGFNLLAAAPPRAVAGEPPPEWDGLTRVPDKGPDHLYLLRGADFSNYNAVKISPIEIAFDKNWDRGRGNNRNPARFVSDQDMEQIRTELAGEFHTIFTNDLVKGGWTISGLTGEHVLAITPAIVNLNITAPNTQQTSGRGHTFVTNTGHMTLFLELRDSVTGQLIGRVVDNVSGRRSGNSFEIAGPVTHTNDVRLAISKWADETMTALNYAKSSSPPGTALAEKPSPNESGQPR